MKNSARYSDAEINDMFLSENWDSLDKEQRLFALNEIERRMAREQHRVPFEVVANVEMDAGAMGFYNGQVICVNPALLEHGCLTLDGSSIPIDNSGMHLLDTVLHEGRHAYQHKYAVDHIADDDTALVWAENLMGGYVSADENYALYGMQPLELDAREFAFKGVTEIFTDIISRHADAVDEFNDYAYTTASDELNMRLEFEKLVDETPELLDEFEERMRRGFIAQLAELGIDMAYEEIEELDIFDRRTAFFDDAIFNPDFLEFNDEIGEEIDYLS